jgi:DNA-binding transcriptional LysR family regulator
VTIEFRHLRYCVALAEEQNFGRAASRLHITQPPLTRQIQQLERELGVQLFVRTHKGVEITAAGETFLDDAYKILAFADQASERTRKADRGELGRLDVGIFGSAVLNIIPRLLLNFRERYPEVDITLHNQTKFAQIDALREGRLTIGFNRLFPEEPGITVETVVSEKILVALKEGHRLAKLPTIPVSELAGEPMILFPARPRPSLADEVVELCRHSGFHPDIVQEAEDVVSSVALVAIGFGICLVPESARNLQLPNVVYKRLATPEPIIDLNCAYRTDDVSPILEAFVDIVHDYRTSREGFGRQGRRQAGTP